MQVLKKNKRTPAQASQNDYSRRRSRKQNQVDNTQRWITEAYLQLLESESSVTVTAICKKAGVGRQTFYRYFASTEEIVRHELKQTEASLLTELEQTGEFPISDYTVHLTILRSWKRQEKLRYLANAPEFAEIYAEGFRSLRSKCEQQFGLAPIENHYVRAYRQNGLSVFYLQWMKNGMRESPEDMAQLLVDCCFPAHGSVSDHR